MNRHRSMLSRRVLCQGCAFCGLEYLIFTFLPIFHQKSSKLSPKSAISSQNAETFNTRYFRKYSTKRHENLTQSCKHKVQFSDAIWWRHNKSKMADGRHIENRFWQYLGTTSTDLYKIWIGNTESHANTGHVILYFRSKIQNHMPIQDTWPKLQFSKIEDGRRPPFWK